MSDCPRRNIWGSFGFLKKIERFQRTRVWRSIASLFFFFSLVEKKNMTKAFINEIYRLQFLQVLLKIGPSLAGWNHPPITLLKIISLVEGRTQRRRRYRRGTKDDTMSDIVRFIRCWIVIFLLFTSNKGGSDCKKSPATTGRPPSYQTTLPFVSYYHAGTQKKKELTAHALVHSLTLHQP